MSRIEILWISPCAPCKSATHAGGKTFSYYFSQFANDKDFNITLICSDLDMADDSKEILNNCTCKIIKKNVPTIYKLSNIESKYNPWNRHAGMLSNYFSNNIKKYCKEMKREGYKPDIVILEWTAIVLMEKEIKRLFSDAIIVASETDVTYIGYERKRNYHSGALKKYWNHKYTWEKKLELSALKECDLILPQNEDNILSLINEGIEEEKTMWLAPYFNRMDNCNRKPNGRDFIFYGAMGRMENHLTALWIIDKVLPLIKGIDVRFIVLGSNPRQELLQYEGQNIHITGFVDNVEPFFETAICLVAPLVLGAGIKVKILEGLSSGIPIITNDIGIEGIPAKDGKEYIHCQNETEFAEAIRKAYYGKLEEIGMAGKRFIQYYYDLNSIYMKYRNKLYELVKQRQSEKRGLR